VGRGGGGGGRGKGAGGANVEGQISFADIFLASSPTSPPLVPATHTATQTVPHYHTHCKPLHIRRTTLCTLLYGLLLLPLSRGFLQHALHFTATQTATPAAAHTATLTTVHTATHTATHSATHGLRLLSPPCWSLQLKLQHKLQHTTTHTANHCTHTATHSVLHGLLSLPLPHRSLQHTASYCNTHYNLLQHTLQHAECLP